MENENIELSEKECAIEFWKNHLARLFIKKAMNENVTIRIENAERELELAYLDKDY